MKSWERLGGGHATPSEEREYRRSIFAPPSDLTVSEWADKHRVLSEGTSPEPGPWRTSRVPYLREIMDAMGDPTVEHIVFMKSSRVGATEAINNFLGYTIDQAAANTMVVHPTVDEAKGWSKEQVAPMLRDTPRLRNRVRDQDSGRRESGDTIQYKDFPGGCLVVMGSNSASGLRRRNIQNVLGDERDAHAASAKGGISKEGDPFELAIKRTENFPIRTIFEASSPTIKGLSRIERAYEFSDQRRYYVPCPHCGHEQVLKWRNLRYTEPDPETDPENADLNVVYICGEISKDGELKAGCGQEITEEYKAWMVQNGKWIAERPGRKIRGYHIWAAYSLLTTWSRLVSQWLRAQGDNELLQVFINTVLGETWSESGEHIEHGALVARRERYKVEVPKGVGVLTAGVDVQGDRLEYSAWGWGAGEESWLIKHEVLWGDPATTDVWQQLDLVLTRVWMHECGAQLKIRSMCIDTGGHHTDEVYRYVKPREKLGVHAIKGVSEPGRAAVGNPSKKNRGKVNLFPLGTEALKDTIFSRLKNTVHGPRCMHFPWVDEEYFRQLTSEVAYTRYVKGRPVRRYVLKEHTRNEALDCAVYALAALIILGPVRDQLGVIVEAVQKGKALISAKRGRRVRSRGLSI